MKILKEQREKLNYKYLVFIYLIICVFSVGPVFSYSFFMQFTSQSPMGNWTQPWHDACEETSIVMIDAFYNHQDLKTESAKYKILNLMGVKNNYIGHSLDENADTIVRLINNYLNWEAMVVVEPILEQIKNELDHDRPIIFPADGLVLKNPNFTGPLDYHVLVISGYDDEKEEFITQEPGTRHGHNYRYSYEIVMKGMHDFLPNNQTSNGRQVLVFTSPRVTFSGESDGDNDELTKDKELKYRTSLVEADTDRDGYLDGVEIKSGFSPRVAEFRLRNGDLIRDGKTARVYLLKNDKKCHVLNVDAFNRNGFKWSDVTTVSNKFFEKFDDGGEIK